MSTHDDLATPRVGGLTEPQRAYLAHEDRTLAVAARERAGILYAGAGDGAALAIAELNALADAADARAARYDGIRQELMA